MQGSWRLFQGTCEELFDNAASTFTERWRGEAGGSNSDGGSEMCSDSDCVVWVLIIIVCRA